MSIDVKTVEAWVEARNAEFKARFEYSYSKLTWQPITIQVGQKWIKLMQGGSVWGFIAKSDDVHEGVPVLMGDLMKPANFRKPAKWSRGNIITGNAACDMYGPAYLK